MKNKKTKNKKSQGQIEMILSFTIFIGFLAVLFYFFSPIQNRSTSTYGIDDAQNKILANLSITYSKVSFILNSTTCNCFSFSNSIQAKSILVKDINGRAVSSVISGGNIYIKPFSSSCDRYYSIYYDGNGLNAYNFTPSSCVSFTSSNYTYGLTFYEKPVLFENLLNFNKSYGSDYQNLKIGLKLNNDFSFSVVNETGTTIIKQSIYRPRSVNVLSGTMPMVAINSDANQTGIIISLQVW